MTSSNNLSVNSVIIIGSGPAGCAAAATCHAAGMKVLLVTDKDEHYPSSEIISPLESIHPGVSSLLYKLGLAGAEVTATRGYYNGIYSGGNYNPLGEDELGPWKGMHINRKIFDAELLKRIQLLDIEVMLQTKVEDFISDGGRVTGIKTNAGDIQASYVIDASGKKALASKKLNFKRKFYSPTFICWTGVSEMPGAFAPDSNAAHFIAQQNGWIWLAPSPPYVAWTRLSMSDDKSLLPPDALKQAKVMGKIEVANMRWRLTQPACREGVVLCGDAAGMLDPAAGQGIFNALVSGMVAANSVNLCLAQPDMEAFHLAGYNDWFSATFEDKVETLKLYYKHLHLNMPDQTF